jgi:DNA sulfur modification protein DndB
LLGDLTEMETSNLAPRSRKLFTLSAIHTATTALLDEIKPESLTERVDLAASYWRIVAEQFSPWQQVFRGEISAGEVRQDFIHTHSIVLHALGKVGNTLLRESLKPMTWEKRLVKLRDIDWHRTNHDVWEGRATNAGKVSKSRTNVDLTTAYIRTILGMPLPPEEQRAEDAFARGEKK